jgi:hypothetical protein
MITDNKRNRTMIVMKAMLEALENGWTVSDVTIVLARGGNDEGRGYLVTLLEPKTYVLQELYLPYSLEAEALLNQANLY